MPNENARQLRRQATEAERRLWAVLRNRRLAGFRFCRQYPMCGLILDFARTKYRLAIEADGSQHVDSPADARQTHILAQHGGAVLRLWNNDIPWRTEAVTEAILAASGKRPLTRSRAMPAITLSRTAGEG